MATAWLVVACVAQVGIGWLLGKCVLERRRLSRLVEKQGERLDLIVRNQVAIGHALNALLGGAPCECEQPTKKQGAPN